MLETLNVKKPIENITDHTLRATFEASRSPLIVTDSSLPDNPITYCNQAFLDLIGYPMKEVIGRNCRFLQGDDTDKDTIAELRNAVHKGESARVVIKNYTKKGKPFWNDLVLSPIKDKKGHVTHFMGMQLDVTARIEAEASLRRKTEELESSNQELEQFTYATSHDLQEPLRMINSYLQLLNKRYADVFDDDAQTFLSYASEGAARLQDLVNDLLLLSRVSNDQERFRSIGLNSTVDRAIDNLKMNINTAKAKVEVNELPTMCVDPVQMTQLFQNLISNALKYADKDRKPQITVSAIQENDGYTFSVKDNGIGIAKKHFDRIFIIFQRLHTRSEYPGTGIGLAICSKIIDRHNGKMWVESTEGEGSDFKFWLPMERGAQ